MNKLVNNQVNCLSGEIWLCKIDNNNDINPHPVIILKNIYNYWYDALQLSTSYYKIKKSKWLIKLNKSNGLRKESYACVSELITINSRNGWVKINWTTIMWN
ncbi:hypothetical protein, partial [Spiroplasma sp. hyd1]|uniref:hypothetical protein n=1 Tax=Spiroplasma sp. hyd1 TaxID=1609976 RepID=UPI001E35CC90